MSLPSFPLEGLGLTSEQLKLCRDANYATAADILVPPIADLNRKLRYPRIQEAQDLVKQIAKAIVPQPTPLVPQEDEGEEEETTGNDVVKGDWVGTGDTAMDDALGGGLRVGTITEISGESASGKSHFCLMAALAAQLPSLTTRPGGTLILTSEREISTDRLSGLAKFMLSAHDPHHRLRTSDLLDHVLTNSTHDVHALETTLNYKLPHILRLRNRPGHPTLDPLGNVLKPIRLLIIDSIAALIRGAEGTYANSTSLGLTERSRHLCAIADRLKHLAHEFGLAVLVVNQVTDVFSRPVVQSSTPTGPSPSQMLSQFYTDGPEPPMLYATQSRWFSGQTTSLLKEASLGIVWANAVNTRIMLSQTKRRRYIASGDLKRKKARRGLAAVPDEEGEDGRDEVEPIIDDTKKSLIRRAHVVFSPFAPPGTLDFVIAETGIHALPDSYRLIDIAETVKRRGRLARALAAAEAEDEDSTRTSQPTDAPAQASSQDVPIVDILDGVHDDDEFNEFDELGPIPDHVWDTYKAT